MSLFDSVIEFLGSGLIVAAQDSLVLEAINGPLRLSSHGGSGVLDYNQASGYWRLRNNGEVQPIMSGINGVSGPNVNLVGGANIAIIPDNSNNSVIIDAYGSGGGITDINGATGPSVTLAGASGVQVETSGNQFTISHSVVGYTEIVPGYIGNQVFTHNLGTTFIVPSFRATSGGGGVNNTVFQPRRVKILNPNQIRVRMNNSIDFEMTLIGYK